MKKIIALVLTGALTLSTVACGTAVSGGTATENTETTQSQSSESTADDGKTTEVEVADYSTLSEDELTELYSKESASNETIHIGYSGGLCQVAIPVAQHYGFFEDEGLVTELTSSEDSRDALAAGKIDTAAGMIAQWLTSVQNGVDIRFTLGLHTGCAAAVVLPDSEYQGFEKGMKIGFLGAFGGVYHYIANRFVAHDGFTEEDFTWLGFDESAILLALQDGEVDAIAVSEQLSKNWEKEGKVSQKRSLTTDDDFKDEACCVLGISGKFLEANPVASYKISRAVYNASNWLAESESNRAEAAKMLIENGYISGTEEYALELLNYYKFGLTPEVTEKSLYDSVDEYTKLGVLDKNADAEAFKKKIYYAYKF